MDYHVAEDVYPSNRVYGSSPRHFQRETEAEHVLGPCGGKDLPYRSRSGVFNGSDKGGSHSVRLNLRVRDIAAVQVATHSRDQGIMELMSIVTTSPYL